MPTEEKKAPPLVFRWQSRLEEVAAEWKECFAPSDQMRSYQLQRVVSESNLEEVEHHYLSVEDAQGVAALIPCYSFRLSLVSLASPRLQRLVSGIQKRFPGFLRARIFVVGSAITTYGDLLGLKDSRWPAWKIHALFEELRRKAQALKIGLILIKELDAGARKLLEVLEPRIFFAESLPSTVLELPPMEKGGYLQAIRTRYRNKLKKRRSVAAESGLTWELTTNIKGYEDRIYELYRQVLEHSEFVFEKLNKEFFVKTQELKDSFYVLGFANPSAENAERRLISCEFVMCGKDSLHPLYSGFDYLLKRDTDLYFNAFYAIIDEAERRGFKRIYFGQTAYEVKAELGCRAEPLWVAIHHRNPFIHWLLSVTRGLTFPKTVVPEREVFGTPPAPKKTGRKVVLVEKKSETEEK